MLEPFDDPGLATQDKPVSPRRMKGLREDIGGFLEDVSAIGADIGKLQESDLATPDKFSEAKIALTKDISGYELT
jgi:hypothetical protein